MKKASKSIWIMCAKSESGDDYCACAQWDHNPSKEEIDEIRVDLDAEEIGDDDEEDMVLQVKGKKYNCYIWSWEINEISI